ncbi:MAG: hypothetical protein AAGJ10_07710 [Bacteroidota bacterium]
MSVGRHRVLLWAVIGLLLPLAGFSQSRTLVVEQGQIFLDGNKLEDPVLLEKLQANGFEQIRLVFDTTGGTPLLTLGGEQYVLLEDRVRRVPMPRSATQVTYRSRNMERAPQQVSFFAQGPALTLGRETSAVVSPHVQQMQAQLHYLQAQAVALERYGLQRGDEQGQVMTEVAAQMIYQVEEAQRVAEALPHAVVEEYYRDVRNANIELYERMVQEAQLDRRTQELALKLRRTAEGEGAQQYREELQATLERLFDLKQQNGRDELARMQAELDAMKRRLDYRQTKRDEIIQDRINALIPKDRER